MHYITLPVSAHCLSGCSEGQLLPKKMRSSEPRQIQKGSASQAGPSPTAPKQKRCSKNSQVQPRIHIIRQYYSNEAGPTSSQQIHPQVSVRIKSSNQQVSPQWWCRAKIKPVSQPSGWDQDQRTTQPSISTVELETSSLREECWA